VDIDQIGISICLMMQIAITMSPGIDIEFDHGIATIALDRPPANAIDRSMDMGIAELFSKPGPVPVIAAVNGAALGHGAGDSRIL
jgi:enoyl-CoA hydratase/carnithine racemase